MINKNFFDGNAYMQLDFQAILYENICDYKFTNQAVKKALSILLYNYDSYFTNGICNKDFHNHVIKTIVEEIIAGKIVNWDAIPTRYNMFVSGDI